MESDDERAIVVLRERLFQPPALGKVVDQIGIEYEEPGRTNGCFVPPTGRTERVNDR